MATDIRVGTITPGSFVIGGANAGGADVVSEIYMGAVQIWN